MIFSLEIFFTRYKFIEYSLNVMHSACLVFNSIIVDNYAAFNYTSIGRADSMMAST